MTGCWSRYIHFEVEHELSIAEKLVSKSIMLNLSGKRTLPSIIQAEAAECGLACIAMIASYYGYQCDLFSLRKKFGSSARGATLQSLMDLAESLELTPRALRVEVDSLKDLSLPAILHWNFNHFVVLKKVRRNSIVIHDPAVGERVYSLSESGQRFTGIVLELSVRSNFNKGENRSQLKLWDFWRGAKGLVPSMIQVLILSLLIQCFAIASPFYMQLVVDDVLVKHDSDLLLILGIGFAGIMLISVCTKALRGFSMVYLTSQMSFNLGSSILFHLIRLPLDYFQKRHLGDVISRFESIKPIQDFITSSSITIVIDGLLATTTLIMIVGYSPRLALVVVSSVVLYAAFRWVQFQPLRNSNHENISATAKLDTLFMETIRSLQSIKLAGRESQRENNWRQQFALSVDSNARIGRLTVTYEAVNSTLTGFEYVLVIFLGANEVLNGSLTIGMLYAFMSFRTHFSNSTTSIVNQILQYKMICLHLERLADITNSEQEEGLQSRGKFTVPVFGRIELRDISYTYAGDNEAVFVNLSTVIPERSFVAVYGPSGIGKSTFLRILMGLAEPSTGEMLVDNQTIKKLGLRSYRKAISAVGQADTLMSGSLKDNISFFDISPDLDRIVDVAKAAEIHEDILSMTMGYESLVGDMGTTLSQGQLQRVIIARSLYSKPKILFLDEGTAHIDKVNEKKIMTNIQSMGISCIYITHNADLLSYADKVIRWDKYGKIEIIDPISTK
ncbi:MAG: ATP-binding cassette subfamily B protein RaxB [Gammaproteobacteria bacterium]